jgi:polysaccharide biosynthesis/export protein
MTKAIRAAILAAIPAICLTAQTAVQEQPQTQPTAAAEQSAQKPASAEGDPAKMAAPTAPSGTLPATSSAASVADEKTFVIGPEDQLAIEVWGDPRIGGAVLVRPDGRISLSLLGEVQAAGRTPAELTNDITEMLRQKEILRRPQVNVKVLLVNSKKYLINGEVMKTGAFPLVVPTRIMDALVNAGGFKDFANKKNIVIIRGTQRLRFNWNEVVKGKKTEQNVYLEHGDIIIVN